MIRKSPVNGVGMFADRDVKKGQYVGWMQMVNVGLAADFDVLPSVGVITETDVYCPVNGFPLWAVNYAPEPNIGANHLGDVIALRNITKGEELFISYHTPPVGV